MALNDDDKRWIISTVVTAIKESETNLRTEIAGLGASLHKEIKETEFNLREEILYNRKEIKSVKEKVKQLREDLEFEGENRVSDSDATFSDMKKLDIRVTRLERAIA